MKSLCTVLGGWILLQACVGDDPVVGVSPARDNPDASTDGSADSATERPSGLTLTADPVEIIRGTEGRVHIRTDWTENPVDLTVEFDGLPPGFTAGGALTLPSGELDLDLPLQVGADAAFGDVVLQVVATSKSSPAFEMRTSAAVFVRGRAGEIDTSFGDGGRAQLPPEEHKVATMRVDAAGRIWVTGYGAYIPEQDTNSRLVVVRYTPDGKLDSSFGSPSKNGIAIWQAPFGLRTAAFLQPYNVDVNGTEQRLSYCYSEVSGNSCAPIQALVSEVGDLRFSPSSKPAVTASVQGVVGALADKMLVAAADTCVVQRMSPNGTPDSTFNGGSTSVVPSRTNVSRCSHTFLGTTETHLILAATAYDTTSASLWKGVVAIDKASGSAVYQASPIPMSGTMRSDGVYVSVSAERSFQKFDGRQFMVVASPLFVPEDSVAVPVPIPNAGIGALMTNGAHAVQYFAFDANDQATSAPVNLEERGVVTGGRDRTFARDGAVDSRRRLLVMMLQKPDEPLTTDYPNPFWVIRRYWLP